MSAVGRAFVLATAAALIATTAPPPALAASGEKVVSFEVSSQAGWVRAPIELVNGQQYTIRATGTWTVDHRNFPAVSAAGYDMSTDQRIWQGCKIGPYPYAKLLVRDGPNGQPTANGEAALLIAGGEQTIHFRINDDDRCLGDNEGSVRITITPGGFPDAPPVLIPEEALGLALDCAVSAVKIPDEEIQKYLDLLLFSKDIVAAEGDVAKTLGAIVGTVRFGGCFKVLFDPPPAS